VKTLYACTERERERERETGGDKNVIAETRPTVCIVIAYQDFWAMYMLNVTISDNTTVIKY
jgi:hypothetical protein